MTTVVLAMIFGGIIGFRWVQAEKPVPEGAFGCVLPRIIDGDTFDCGGTRERVRLRNLIASRLYQKKKSEIVPRT